MNITMTVKKEKAAFIMQFFNALDCISIESIQTIEDINYLGKISKEEEKFIKRGAQLINNKEEEFPQEQVLQKLNELFKEIKI